MIECPHECSSPGFRFLPQGVGVIASPEYSLTVEFDGGHAGESLDLRPKIPLVLKR
jgi:hypothetical protein